MLVIMYCRYSVFRSSHEVDISMEWIYLKNVRNFYGNQLRCCHGNHGRVGAEYIYTKPFINYSKFPILGILSEVIRGTWFIEIDRLIMNEDNLKRFSKWRTIWQKSLHSWILVRSALFLNSEQNTKKDLLLHDRRRPQISHVSLLAAPS